MRETSSVRPPVAVLAGRGQLPLAGIEALRRQGERVVVVAGVPGCDPALADQADAVTDIPFPQWQNVVEWLWAQGVQQAYFLGKVSKEWLQQPGWDERAQAVLARLSYYNDDAVLRAFVDDLADSGIIVGSQAALLRHLLAPPGQWSGSPLEPGQRRDVAYGFHLAKALGGMDVGQLAVVKGGVTLALEAIEGTDACLQRAAKLGGRGAVAVKVAKPQQDERFDLPTVGPQTIELLIELGYAVLAVEAGRTLVIDRERLVARAQAVGLKLVGWMDSQPTMPTTARSSMVRLGEGTGS